MRLTFETVIFVGGVVLMCFDHVFAGGALILVSLGFFS